MCGRILSSTSKRCHSIRKPCIVGRAAGSTTRTSTAILGETPQPLEAPRMPGKVIPMVGLVIPTVAKLDINKLWMVFFHTTLWKSSLSRNRDQWDSVLTFIFPTCVVPKKLKVGHWISEKRSVPSRGTVASAKSVEGEFWKDLWLNPDYSWWIELFTVVKRYFLFQCLMVIKVQTPKV